jgi:glutamate/aspartate transport system substrate-binding protein
MKSRHSLIRMLCIAALATASFVARSEVSGSTLERISARGSIFLGYDETSVPFSFAVSGSDEPMGMGVDICHRVVKAIEEKLGKKLLVQPVPLSSNTPTMMVKTGMADIGCGAHTNTVGRAQQVAFSTTFFVSEVRAMVPVESAGKSLKDMDGKRVVTTVGEPADRLIKQAALSRGVSIRTLLGRNPAQSMSMLVAGNADAYVTEYASLLASRAESAKPEKYAILDESYSVEPYALILPKDDAQFKQLVDDVVLGLMKSGEMERLYDTWFMKPIPPGNRNLNFPISPLNKAAYANPNDRPVN